MKSLIFPTFVIMLSLICSCESFYEEEDVKEEDVICLPVNMTATLIQGAETEEISADFYYIPDTELLDHIAWSNNQTHLFRYDESYKLKILKKLKVDDREMEELWFTYDGSLVERIDLIKRNLDPVYLDPLDSINMGYVEFEYLGKDVITESRYELSPKGTSGELINRVVYGYDERRNITSRRTFDPRSYSVESVHMTYDASKHPFSGLQYYFNGESFINNHLSKSLVEDDFEYNYDLQLNEYGYPETIYETLNATDSQIISYTYIKK